MGFSHRLISYLLFPTISLCHSSFGTPLLTFSTSVQFSYALVKVRYRYVKFGFLPNHNSNLRFCINFFFILPLLDHSPIPPRSSSSSFYFLTFVITSFLTLDFALTHIAILPLFDHSPSPPISFSSCFFTFLNTSFLTLNFALIHYLSLHSLNHSLLQPNSVFSFSLI